MLSAEMRERLVVGLIGARNPSNIGAAARAMRDFGFSHLRLVNEYSAPFEAAEIEAAKSAVGAHEIMRSARAFPSVAAAVSDCTLVIGTTAIGDRQLTRQVLPVVEASQRLKEELGQPLGRVAMLFGSEKTGLTNDQLSHCDVLVTIPMFAPVNRHLSMNLGQAVAVCLYELVREGFEGSRQLPPSSSRTATAEDRELLTQLLLQAMSATGYSRRFPANSRVQVVRQLVRQLGSTPEEASTWMGFFRQVLRAAPTVAENDEAAGQ